MKRAYMNSRIHEFASTRAAGEAPPQWASQVSRWSQLDSAAYGVTDAVFHWKNTLARPDLIVLASPGASNETDRRFALGGASSPSLFVHTLPNIRCSPCLQVMEWSGPVLCVQNDPTTFVAGVREGFALLNDELPVIWVIAVESRLSDSHGVYLVELKVSGDGSHQIFEAPGLPSEMKDKDWLNWLESGGENFVLDGLKIESNELK